MFNAVDYGEAYLPVPVVVTTALQFKFLLLAELLSK